MYSLQIIKYTNRISIPEIRLNKKKLILNELISWTKKISSIKFGISKQIWKISKRNVVKNLISAHVSNSENVQVAPLSYSFSNFPLFIHSL